MYLIYILGTAVLLYLIGAIRVLKQYERGVVFFLGKFEDVRGAGITLIFFQLQQMVRVSLRTVTMQIPSQKIITKDNVSIDIAAVAYYHISNPENAVIVIENVYNAINQISQTTVRNVVGRFSLDQLLSDTAGINDQIRSGHCAIIANRSFLTRSCGFPGNFAETQHRQRAAIPIYKSSINYRIDPCLSCSLHGGQSRSPPLLPGNRGDPPRGRRRHQLPHL
jgi:hypothetical protein